MRKLISFDDETADKLKQLGRDRFATLQDLADEAFADLLKKHGVPIDLHDALRKSESKAKAARGVATSHRPPARRQRTRKSQAAKPTAERRTARP